MYAWFAFDYTSLALSKHAVVKLTPTRNSHIAFVCDDLPVRDILFKKLGRIHIDTRCNDEMYS